MKIAIIGAGASGFMAAITAKEKNNHAQDRYNRKI